MYMLTYAGFSAFLCTLTVEPTPPHNPLNIFETDHHKVFNRFFFPKILFSLTQIQQMLIFFIGNFLASLFNQLMSTSGPSVIPEEQSP